MSDKGIMQLEARVKELEEQVDYFLRLNASVGAEFLQNLSLFSVGQDKQVLIAASHRMAELEAALAEREQPTAATQRDALEEAAKLCDAACKEYTEQAKKYLENGRGVLMGHRQLVAASLAAAIRSHAAHKEKK